MARRSRSRPRRRPVGRPGSGRRTPSARRSPTASCAPSCSRAWPTSSMVTPPCARRSRPRWPACSARPLPEVPGQGNGGAGEIVALGRLFYDLSARLDLEPKERMALINGSPCAAALVADVALAGQARLRSPRACSRSPSRPPGAARGLLRGPRGRCGTTSTRRPRCGRCARCSPVRPTTARRTRARSASASCRGCSARCAARRPRPSAPAAVSLRSVTDNPVYLLPDADRPLGAVISTGGYHNARAPGRDGRRRERVGRPVPARPAAHRQAAPAPGDARPCSRATSGR